MYCPNCGNQVNPNDNYCGVCGADLNNYTNSNRTNVSRNGKSRLVAGIREIIPGLGIGRFYLGYTNIGIAQLLLSFIGVGSIWCLVDGILILIGKLNYDANGNQLAD